MLHACNKSGYCMRHRHLSPRCKEYTRTWRAENPERCKLYTDTWRSANPEKVKSRQLAYRQENADRRKAYRDSRREHNRVYQSKYAAANPQAGVLKFHKRRALKAGNGGSFSQAEWSELLSQHNAQCAACGCGGRMTVDHIVPLSKGGRHSKENIQPLCSTCNKSKGVKGWAEFLTWRAEVSK